jgi:hypothetical protein
MRKAIQESVITVREGEELVAIVHKNGNETMKVYMTRLANWEDMEKLLDQSEVK